MERRGVPCLPRCLDGGSGGKGGLWQGSLAYRSYLGANYDIDESDKAYVVVALQPRFMYQVCPEQMPSELPSRLISYRMTIEVCDKLHLHPLHKYDSSL